MDRSNAWPLDSVTLASARGIVCFRKLFLAALHSPFSDSEATALPLLKGGYNQELHLAIGLLRMFDAEANSLVQGNPPQCDFRNSPYIEAGGKLNEYGPLYFVITEQILPKLSPKLGDMFCNANTPEQVAKAMQATFTR